MTAKQVKPKTAKSKDRIAEFYKISSLVMSKVGITGFIVINAVFYIFWFVPDDQKREITNTWLLFKCQDCNYLYILILVSLMVIFLIQNYFYKRAIKMKDERIVEISKEKKELQEKFLNKRLNSSKEEQP